MGNIPMHLVKRLKPNPLSVLFGCIPYPTASPFLIRPGLRRATFPPGEGIFPSHWCFKQQFLPVRRYAPLFFRFTAYPKLTRSPLSTIRQTLS